MSLPRAPPRRPVDTRAHGLRHRRPNAAVLRRRGPGCFVLRRLPRDAGTSPAGRIRFSHDLRFKLGTVGERPVNLAGLLQPWEHRPRFGAFVGPEHNPSRRRLTSFCSSTARSSSSAAGRVVGAGSVDWGRGWFDLGGAADEGACDLSVGIGFESFSEVFPVRSASWRSSMRSTKTFRPR